MGVEEGAHQHFLAKNLDEQKCHRFVISYYPTLPPTVHRLCANLTPGPGPNRSPGPLRALVATPIITNTVILNLG